jgi:hypothetical protein
VPIRDRRNNEFGIADQRNLHRLQGAKTTRMAPRFAPVSSVEGFIPEIRQ